VIIRVKVKLHSGASFLEKISGGEYVARLKSLPEKGKANMELVKLLSREFGVSQNKVRVKTPTSRNKIVEILSY
jgi:uncharacterized protein